MYYKDDNGKERMDTLHLSLELLKTMHDIDVRISELKMVLGNPDDWQKDRRKSIVDRIHRLIETRFTVMYSFMDINGSSKLRPKGETNSANPFDKINLDYKALKRHV